MVILPDVIALALDCGIRPLGCPGCGIILKHRSILILRHQNHKRPFEHKTIHIHVSIGFFSGAKIWEGVPFSLSLSSPHFKDSDLRLTLTPPPPTPFSAFFPSVDAQIAHWLLCIPIDTLLCHEEFWIISLVCLRLYIVMICYGVDICHVSCFALRITFLVVETVKKHRTSLVNADRRGSFI